MFPVLTPSFKYNQQLKDQTKIHLLNFKPTKQSSTKKPTKKTLQTSVMSHKLPHKVSKPKRKIQKNSYQFMNFMDKQINSHHEFYPEELDGNIQIQIKKFITDMKPPHRYKTQIIVTRNSIVLFGGLGCDKNLLWAKLNISDEKWHFPQEFKPHSLTYYPHVPLIGHSFIKHKEKGIIYGGFNVDDTNQTSILDLKTMQFEPGSRSPVRRRYHAATSIGRYMIIHGGIQVRQTQAEAFLYDTEANKWFTPTCTNFPALSHHRMVNPCQNKRKKKPKFFQTQLYNECIYIFGGLNSKNKAQNILYRLKLLSEDDLTCEKVELKNSPAPRHSCCFEALNTKTLVVYGGKHHDEIDDTYVRGGIFCDIHLLDMDKNYWIIPKLPSNLEYRFGMCSAAFNHKIYVFGGSLEKTYTNADITIISFQGEGNSPFGTEISLPTGKKIL